MKNIIWNIFYFTALLVSEKVLASSSCQLRKTCDECITDVSKCVWCAMNTYNGTRCNAESEIFDNWCPANAVRPKSNMTVEQNVEFNSTMGNVIQMKPQNIKINLRPRYPVNFDFSIKLAKDYPVDLYFLLDASDTMRDVKSVTVSQTESIYQAMQKLTNNVFLGTGLFVDKNALPYTRLKNSTLAFSFRNRLKLTDEFKTFQQVVNETEFGRNQDAEEGTLDALAQVITCKDEIGWRNESTKIIIVLTDSPYHSAGDGKWAGIFRPYDGKCYTENGIYKNELLMDYPSVGIINKLAADEEMIIIFAVPEGVENEYKTLSNAISGSKFVNYGGDNKSVMSNILKRIYKEITQYIRLKVKMNNIDPRYFRITFNPNCYRGNKNCWIQQGKEEKISATIELLEYLDLKNFHIDILFEGNKEKLRLNIDVIKTCECEEEIRSEKCNKGGNHRCGICECNSDRYGNKCQCDKTNSTAKPNDHSSCIAPLSNGAVCNGHGTCDCGKCICFDKYLGTYCECHENSCEMYNGKVCSDNGICTCGKCVCNKDFTGKACECSLSKDKCMGEGDSECNNRGTCVCGKCLDCQNPSDWDVRQLGDLCKLVCPDQKACHNRQCQKLEPTAVCTLKQKDCYDKSINASLIDSVNSPVLNDSIAAWQRCPNVRTDVGCYTTFFYRYFKLGYGIEIIVQSDTDCVESYYVYGGACCVALILIGVIALITWKCIVDKRDRMEYERFKTEAGLMKSPRLNPVYTPATSTFNNPGFRKRSDRRRSSSAVNKT